jgi:hypothetical protein
MSQGNDQFLTLRQASSSALTNYSPSEKCDPRIAARLAAALFGCYRAAEANDPETFLAAATAMLAQYPEQIAAKVCDPIRGLSATSKWLPAIAEIREACEREMVWHDTVGKRERERAHTRAVLEAHKAPLGALEHRRVAEGFAELRASMHQPDPSAPKPFTSPVAEARSLFAQPAQVNTPEMAAYLANLRDEFAIPADVSA